MATETKVPFLVLTFFLAMSLIKMSKANDVKIGHESIIEDRHVTELFFSDGKNLLSTTSKHELVRNYLEALESGKVVEAKIFSWGDKVDGTVANKTLKRRLKIVEDRNDKIESIIEELDLQLPVRKYNLAEREDILLKLTPQKDREILNSLRKFNDYYSRSLVYFEVK